MAIGDGSFSEAGGWWWAGVEGVALGAWECGGFAIVGRGVGAGAEAADCAS